MQDRAERQENRDARLVEARREFHELKERGDLNLALAVYRCRLLAIYGRGHQHEINTVIAFDRRQPCGTPSSSRARS